MIPIKKGQDIDGMRESCRVVAEIREELRAFIEPGKSTRDVDEYAAALIRQRGGVSPFFGYRGTFPGHICISINEEVVHGIGGTRRIKYGDLVKIDVGIILNGWVGDTATTVAVGDVGPDCNRLIQATQDALAVGIRQAMPGNRVHDISAAIERVVHGRGYSVVREFVGHGVGRELHEPPHVPNGGVRAGTGSKLKPGMTLAIEPMVNMGRPEVRPLADGWTIVTADNRPSAHFEHTVLITTGEPEILTCLPVAAASSLKASS
jgi:methionyl aminopeptidase